MLAYAFQSLNEKSYAEIEAEEFENVSDLLAAILVKGISNQVKRGIGREYIIAEELLSTPVGRINVSASIKNNSIVRKQLFCNYDNFSENTYMNQILKTTMIILMKFSDVSNKQKKSLKQLLMYFSNVNEIRKYDIKWNKLNYHKNISTYKMLMYICYLIIDSMIMSYSDGIRKLANFIDDQKMSRLYEKFVLEYYRKHYPSLKAIPSYIEWNTNVGFRDFLPAMKTDITLEKDDKILIIDTKYYSRTMQNNPLYDKSSVHSNNLYQIFTYVKNKDKNNSGMVSGMLLYAKTDEELTPNFDYIISGNRIGVKTLDLNTDFKNIKSQLNAIVEEYLY